LAKIAPDVGLPIVGKEDDGPVHLDPWKQQRSDRNNKHETGNLQNSIEIGVEPRDKDATAIMSFKKDQVHDQSSEHDLNATHGSMNKHLLGGVNTVTGGAFFSNAAKVNNSNAAAKIKEKERNDKDVDQPPISEANEDEASEEYEETGSGCWYNCCRKGPTLRERLALNPIEPKEENKNLKFAENFDKGTLFENWNNDKWHIFAKKSLFMLDNKNNMRKRVVKIITHKWFDRFIVFLIGINSIMLGCRDYTDFEGVTPTNKFIDKADGFFVVAFAIECILKIIGMGFICGKNSYLKDTWNWLDFIVVVSSLMTEIPALQSVSGMRTFRLMRPLRSLTTMPSMKILISTLLASVA
jgi:hypothetical protein